MHKVFFKKGRTVAAQFIHLPVCPSLPPSLRLPPAYPVPLDPPHRSADFTPCSYLPEPEKVKQRERQGEREGERVRLLFALINVDRFILKDGGGAQ